MSAAVVFAFRIFGSVFANSLDIQFKGFFAYTILQILRYIALKMLKGRHLSIRESSWKKVFGEFIYHQNKQTNRPWCFFQQSEVDLGQLP